VKTGLVRVTLFGMVRYATADFEHLLCVCH